MALFGPDFEKHGQESADETEPPRPADAPAAVGKATKGKIAAKATGYTYQFQIMESIGVPRSEIKKFADPQHWLAYFPPICMVSPSAPITLLFPNRRPNRKTTQRSARASTGAARS
jgi:leucyl-tRNA synthetase